MSTPRFTTSRRAPSYDLDDPVEQKVAELQALTGAHLSLRRVRFRGGWEARVNGRRWRMGSRHQLMMEVLEHLSDLARSTVRTSDASERASENASGGADASNDDAVVDLTDRRTADHGDRFNLDQSNPVAGLAGPVEETGP